MSDSDKPEVGAVAWRDLTVPNATEIKDFYAAVVGWKPEPVDMGDYSDFSMNAPESGAPMAGVCHARGTNANLPPQWLVYFVVADLDRSTSRCTDLGGEILVQPKSMGSQGRYCVVRDPAGAVAALVEPAG